MLINNKIFFKSITHNNKYILINNSENKIYLVDKEIIKKELFEEIKKKYKDSGKIKKEFKEREKEIFFQIETVQVEYNPHNPAELYKRGDFLYYNLFKNTPIRKKMLKIHEEYKKNNKLIKDYKFIEKYKYINLLFDSLTNFNKEHKKYLINWLSYVFITHQKTMNTIIFKGVEGTGKGLLYDFIICKVFYTNQTTVISNDELNNSFNEFLENKSFIIANEVQDYTNKKSVYEKLKQWITDKTILLNSKHINMRNIENKTNFLIYSNNDFPVPITATDRRYSVINTTDTKLEVLVEKEFNISIIEYVKNLENEVEDFLLDLSRFDFSEIEAKKILINKEREYIIMNTEEKIKILKQKLKNLDKKWLIEEFFNEYLFDVKKDDYFNITKELDLGNVDNDVEETHKIIVKEIIEAIETKNFAPSDYLKYFLYWMYYEQKTLKELNKYINKIGEKAKNPTWIKKPRRGVKLIPINSNYNKEIEENEENEVEKLKQKIKDLEKENEKLKREIEKLKLENKRYLNKIVLLKNETIDEDIDTF